MDLTQIPDPNDSWAQVELHRWQYGGLPQPGDERPLDVSEGLLNMAAAMRGDQHGWPAPLNVVSVLEYVAKILRQADVKTQNN